MGVRVALALDLPVAVDEDVRALGGTDGIHHHGKVAAGGILHANGHVEAAGGEPMLLVLDAAGADCDIRYQVCEEMVVLGIKHLVGA